MEPDFETEYVVTEEEMYQEIERIVMKDLPRGMKDGLPIALGYISVSFTFGLMAVSAGMSWWQAALISMCNVTSAGQFAGLDIMMAGGMMIEMAMSQFIINLRYALMSLSLSQKVDRSICLRHRFIIGMGITDEIFAVAMSQKDKVSRWYMYGLIIVPYFGWAGGTAAGALFGSILPEMVRDSMGIAIYGMFLAIILPKARQEKSFLIVIVLAVVLSCGFALLPVLRNVSSGFVIIICAVFASGVGAWLFPIREEKNDSEKGEQSWN